MSYLPSSGRLKIYSFKSGLEIVYRVRDFIETHDGLIFSVISNLHPHNGILSHPRFVRKSDGSLRKLSSSREAYNYLSSTRPHYLKFCPELDKVVPIVSQTAISHHYEPIKVLGDIMRDGKDPEVSTIVTSIISRAGISLDEVGITGSYLLGAQTKSSDIDLVFYGLGNHPDLTRGFLECVDEGIFILPGEEDWRDIYNKRMINPGDYSLEKFAWHESRKHNRGRFGNRRFDILYGRKEEEIEGSFSDYSYKGLGTIEATYTVTDSDLAHDYPAVYRVSDCESGDPDVSEVVSFTHTYVEQARRWERIVCRGILERVTGVRNYRRILVGSSREARGEYIKVLGSTWMEM
jgi:predicted nucleotidyltransferase